MESTHILKSEIVNNLKPRYSKTEELLHMISHMIGIVFGVVAMVMTLIKAIEKGNVIGVIASAIYGISVIILYTCSSAYHGIQNEKNKKLFRIFDHCSIYLLIAGTYTVIALSGVLPVHPTAACLMLAGVWSLAILAIVLNAISIEKFKVVSMIVNILAGWLAIFFSKQIIEAISVPGFLFIVAGGVAYTLGAVLYGIGRKKKYFHFIFHLFVLLGTVLQFIPIYMYCL